MTKYVAPFVYGHLDNNILNLFLFKCTDVTRIHNDASEVTSGKSFSYNVPDKIQPSTNFTLKLISTLQLRRLEETFQS